jgi:copper transport protein
MPGTNAVVPGIHLPEPRSTSMAQLSTAARRVAHSATLAVLFALLFASPAAAHAELVNITPANGAQLTSPPTEVRMTFTESVNLVEDGIRLVNHVGATVATPDPTVRGRTIIWPMPAKLPEGPYVVTWRVVSSDGHPVSGAFSFGVGTAAVAVPGAATGAGTAGTSARTVATGSSAPWPVLVSRLAGYIAFALVGGVAAFVMFCAPGSSKDPTVQLLVRCGLLAGAAAAVAGILVQGPYTAGGSMSRVLDMQLLQETLSTPFGTAMMWRLALYGVLGVLIWRLPRILTELASWLVPAVVVGIAVTIAAAGHAAASGPLSLLVDALHALTAALWVGGLVAVVAVGRSVEPRTLHRFSTLAMASVLTIVVTGTLNSIRHLTAVEQLWLTRYGLTLVIKLSLVAGALTAAAVSRRRMGQNRVPRRSVRLEAALTVTVLLVTALLTTTAPPPQATGPTSHTDHGAGLAAAGDAVQMSLGDQGEAALAVLPATTTGSHLHLVLTDPKGQKLPATRVTLKVANPGRDIAPIPVPMSMRDGVWVANYRFPFPGTWKTILTVDGVGPSAIVTSADVTIRD